MLDNMHNKNVSTVVFISALIQDKRTTQPFITIESTLYRKYLHIHALWVSHTI